MKRPEITIDKVKTLLETRFLNVYDLQYQEGKHYYDASRRKKEDLTALISDEEFLEYFPDAVTLCVVLRMKDADRLLLFYEYRYPTGRFLLSPPAGLIDPQDREYADAIERAAARELFEETGISFDPDKDSVKVLNRAVFSSPGMTDESNAIALIVINEADPDVLTDQNTEGSEVFDGYRLLDKEQALDCLKKGTDRKGNVYSVYTWQALLLFASDLWKSL